MRGAEAQALLDHPLFKEAFETIHAELVREWEAAPARDSEGRERIWMMTKILGKVRLHIEHHVNTGKLASKQLADLENKSKITSIFGR